MSPSPCARWRRVSGLPLPTPALLFAALLASPLLASEAPQQQGSRAAPQTAVAAVAASPGQAARAGIGNQGPARKHQFSSNRTKMRENVKSLKMNKSDMLPRANSLRSSIKKKHEHKAKWRLSVSRAALGKAVANRVEKVRVGVARLAAAGRGKRVGPTATSTSLELPTKPSPGSNSRQTQRLEELNEMYYGKACWEDTARTREAPEGAPPVPETEVAGRQNQGGEGSGGEAGKSRIAEVSVPRKVPAFEVVDL